MSNTNKDSIHDPARLQEIADLDLFSADLSDLVDDLVEKGAKRLNLPYCSISIVLDEAQFFLSLYGTPNEMIAASGGTPLEWSFCRMVVQDAKEFVVCDALAHPAVKDNPLVQVDGLQCYLGVPMTTSRGHMIGSFCAFGLEKRSFSSDDINDLRRMAAEAVKRLEARVGRKLDRELVLELIRRSQTLRRPV